MDKNNSALLDLLVKKRIITEKARRKGCARNSKSEDSSADSSNYQRVKSTATRACVTNS